MKKISHTMTEEELRTLRKSLKYVKRLVENKKIRDKKNYQNSKVA